MASGFDVSRNPVAGGVMIGIATTALNVGDETDRSFIQIWDEEREWPAPLLEAGPFVVVGFVENALLADVLLEIRVITDATLWEGAAGLLADLEPDCCEAVLAAWLAKHPCRARAVH